MRGLDAKIFEKVYGPVRWVRWIKRSEFDPLEPWADDGEMVDCHKDDEGAFPVSEDGDVPRYHTDANAALLLTEYLKEKYQSIQAIPSRDHGWYVRVWNDDGRIPLHRLVYHGDTLGMAICRTVLGVHGAEEKAP